MQDYIDSLNVSWEKHSTRDLTRYAISYTMFLDLRLTAWAIHSYSHDVELRWFGNQYPLPDSDKENLGDFYDLHNISQHRDAYFSHIPTGLRHMKGPIVHLQLFIDVDRVCTVGLFKSHTKLTVLV